VKIGEGTTRRASGLDLVTYLGHTHPAMQHVFNDITNGIIIID
jgi:hypothetical protein